MGFADGSARDTTVQTLVESVTTFTKSNNKASKRMLWIMILQLFVAILQFVVAIRAFR